MITTKSRPVLAAALLAGIALSATLAGCASEEPAQAPTAAAAPAATAEPVADPAGATGPSGAGGGDRTDPGAGGGSTARGGGSDGQGGSGAQGGSGRPTQAPPPEKPLGARITASPSTYTGVCNKGRTTYITFTAVISGPAGTDVTFRWAHGGISTRVTLPASGTVTANAVVPEPEGFGSDAVQLLSPVATQSAPAYFSVTCKAPGSPGGPVADPGGTETHA